MVQREEVWNETRLRTDKRVSRDGGYGHVYSASTEVRLYGTHPAHQHTKPCILPLRPMQPYVKRKWRC